MPEFAAWLQQGTPEQCVPRLWEEEKPLTPIGTAMYQLLVIQVNQQLKKKTINSPMQIGFYFGIKANLLQ